MGSLFTSYVELTLVINRFSIAAIALTGPGGNLVDGNYIGTDASGLNARPGQPPVGLQSQGIIIDSSSNNIIGGTTAAARNIISGNQGVGIHIERSLRSLVQNNQVQGNYIGLAVNGNAPVGNGLNGVEILTGANNIVGGTVAGARNVISGNLQPGVALAGFSPTVCNLVQGNYIGTNAAGSAPLANGGAGVLVGGILERNSEILTATRNIIGGTTVAARNVISGNQGVGVALENTGTIENQVQGNFIGSDASGTFLLGNTQSGVLVTFANNNTVGGTVAGAGNMIVGNGDFGVGVGLPFENPLTHQLIVGGKGIDVLGNFIGTNAAGTANLGNGKDGVLIAADAVDNVVASNLIAFNGGNGIFIPKTTPGSASLNPGVRNNLDGNLIYLNALLGIDLQDPGVTANDQLDADGGANLQQNFPMLTSASNPFASPIGAGLAPQTTITIGGTLNSTPNTTFTVHWYFSGAPQCTNNQAPGLPLAFGKVQGVMTNGGGNASFSFPFTFPGATTTGIINTTATDPQGNTSEFSTCYPVNATSSALNINTVSPRAGRTAGGQTVTLTGTFNGLSAVMLGGVAATINSNNGTQLVITTPAHAAGAVQIDLVPTSGSTYTKANAFAYLATTFTDNTLVAGVTTAKAQHILELRQAVDALRSTAGLAPATWTDATLTPGGTIRAVHIVELRSYLEDVATRLGYTATTYTDPSLLAGTPIKRIHIEELRQRIRTIAGS